MPPSFLPFETGFAHLPSMQAWWLLCQYALSGYTGAARGNRNRPYVQSGICRAQYLHRAGTAPTAHLLDGKTVVSGAYRFQRGTEICKKQSSVPRPSLGGEALKPMTLLLIFSQSRADRCSTSPEENRYYLRKICKYQESNQ